MGSKAPHKNRCKPTDVLYEKTRAKIRTTQIVNRLNKNMLGILKNDVTGELIELTTGQIRSAEILLSKSLPSLTSTEVKASIKVGYEGATMDEIDERIKELKDK